MAKPIDFKSIGFVLFRKGCLVIKFKTYYFVYVTFIFLFRK